MAINPHKLFIGSSLMLSSPARPLAILVLCLLFVFSSFRLLASSETQIFTYPNGLKLYVAVDKTKPRVQSIIAVHAGSKNDPSDATGLAHYLEHMLFKGTDRLGTVDPKAELPLIAKIEELFERYRATSDTVQRAMMYRMIDSISGVAARLAVPNEYDKLCQSLGCEGTNAFTTTDVTAYLNDVPSNRLDAYYTLEVERFRAPVLRLFHTELEAVYEEKNGSLDEDYSLAYDTLLAALFPTHPYGTQSTLGTTQHLKNPSMKRIREYYDAYYQPSNMVIILAGDVDPVAAQRLVERTFGSLPSKPAPAFKKGSLPPINKPIEKTVMGPDAEWVQIAFRWPGMGHPDIPALQMMDMILSNSKAGLIDINLRQAQKVLSATSTQDLMADHCYNDLSGKPLPGQTLEEVRSLLLSQIDLVKKGAFEDWLIDACVRDMRMRRIRELETYQGKAFYILGALSYNLPYEEYIKDLDQLAAVTKEEVIRVANTYYGNNYVTVFKRTGERTDIESVVKPEITPVDLNRDTTTAFAESVLSMPFQDLTPVFFDLQRDIDRASVRKDIPLLAVRNTENQLYDLTFLIKNGTKNDRYLRFALDYLRYLSTPTRSNEQLAKDQFKLGMSFAPFCTDRMAYITLTGLDETFDESVSLMESIISECVANEEALASFKERTKKSRRDALKDKSTILYRGLMPYVLNGKLNSTTNALTDAEIDAVTSADLIRRIKDLLSYPHEILYYGPRTAGDAARIVRERHTAPTTLRQEPPLTAWPTMPLDRPEVIVVHHDMVQAEVFLYGRSLPRYDTTSLAISQLFGAYFDGGMGTIVFQTLRESKALAYSTGSYLQTPVDTTQPYVMTGYIGTQSDKLIEAIDGLRELLHTLPSIPSSMENARSSVKQSIASDRIVRDDILWNDVSARYYGYKTDQRRGTYTSIDSFTMDDLQAFYSKSVKDRCKVIAILADTSKIDMKALEKYGPVRVVQKSELFPYSE
ncbi:MAG TPA: insulinase family protein [Candidatus Didemnitutus sp.]|nr:insulinase family protein [Candidatus Didemnitutus sp.]